MGFDHDRLAVYGKAREFHQLGLSLAADLPRGWAELANQLRRASSSIVLNIAEGAGEWVPAEKARFYRMAKRSGNECAAILDIVEDARLRPPQSLIHPRSLLSEITAMLVPMIRRHEKPAHSPSPRR